MSLGTAPLLCGRASREMRSQLEKVTGDTRPIILRMFSKFFSVSMIASINKILKKVLVCELHFYTDIYYIMFIFVALLIIPLIFDWLIIVGTSV